jgi:hypothetical protein
MKRRILENGVRYSRVSNSGRIAIISLVSASEQTNVPESELVNEVRRVLKSSSLSESWRVEKIAILDESTATVKTSYPRTQLARNRIP